MRQKIVLSRELVESSIACTNSLAEAAIAAEVSYQTFSRRAKEFGLHEVSKNRGLKGTTKPWSRARIEIEAKKQQARIARRTEKEIYYEECRFDLGEVIQQVRGYHLLVQHGMYSRNFNPAGVVRDHRYSVCEGFCRKVDPRIISHPANCEFLQHKANASKSRKSSITLKELLDEIEVWEGEPVRVPELLGKQMDQGNLVGVQVPRLPPLFGAP